MRSACSAFERDVERRDAGDRDEGKGCHREQGARAATRWGTRGELGVFGLPLLCGGFGGGSGSGLGGGAGGTAGVQS